MHHLVSILLLTMLCGCNIPIYSVTPTSYRNTWVERELDKLLPLSISHEEARSILKKHGYDDVLVIARENDGVMQNELVASKRRYGDEIIRVTMPIANEQITRPFRIDWVETGSGKITSSVTTGN